MDSAGSIVARRAQVNELSGQGGGEVVDRERQAVMLDADPRVGDDAGSSQEGAFRSGRKKTSGIAALPRSRKSATAQEAASPSSPPSESAGDRFHSFGERLADERRCTPGLIACQFGMSNGRRQVDVNCFVSNSYGLLVTSYLEPNDAQRLPPKYASPDGKSDVSYAVK